MAIKSRIKRQRRGLSTIVGAVFMILIIASALNVTLWTMREQDRVTESIIEKTNSNLNRLNEDISISDFRISGGKMNMTVTNAGGAASHLKSLYLVNETSMQQFRYDIDATIDGRKSVTNIGQTTSATIKDNTNYSVKVVSQSGVTASTNVSPISSVGLSMSLIVIPPTVVPGTNVTLLFAVANNATDSFIPALITPTLSKSCSPACTFTDYVTPQSAYLRNGNTAFFKWVIGADGADGVVMTFNASLSNAKQGNYVIEKGLLQTIKSSEESEIFVGSTLLAKPEVFIIAPGPFGDSGNNDDQGYWGIAIANPIDIKMNITQVTINLFSSNTDSSHKPLTSSGCGIVGITPTTGWTCPHDGTLRWSNSGSYITINPYEVYTFMAKADPGGINSVEPALLISVTAFSNLGQFAKQGYATNMFTTTAPIAQVYLTDTTNPATAIIDSPTNHIKGDIKMNSGQQRRINVTVADFEKSNNVASRILAGGLLIINVPKNFTNITIPSPLPSGFSSVSVLPTFADGTTQIRATFSEAIGDVTATEAKVFYFDATAPTVAISRTYVMHTFLDGLANTSPQFEVDAFGTFGILICTSGC
jgi:hypothetical protein